MEGQCVATLTLPLSVTKYAMDCSEPDVATQLMDQMWREYAVPCDSPAMFHLRVQVVPPSDV